MNVRDISVKAKPVFAKYGFRKVGVFGSYARGSARAGSDIDFLYATDAAEPLSFLERRQAETELESLLGVPVDLVPDTRVVARMRPSIKRDLKVIYERERSKGVH